VKYVVVTAARNEEAFIAKTLESVIGQTKLPERWIVVDDGSTDKTAAIVASHAERHPWIELVRRPPRVNRTFAGKAHAINDSVERLRSSLPFDVVVNLDADVSFEADYMQFVLQKFADDAELGVAGTPFTEEGGYDSTRDSCEGGHYVAGPCQLFRDRCFREIGGYVPNAAGGVDWIAVMTARMKGWKVRSFSEKRFHHHRSMGTAERGPLAALFSYGEKDYYLGGSPVWQLFRVAYRMTKQPFLTGGLALLAGYSWAALRRIERPVSAELVQFHRRDQMQKLTAIVRSIISFKRFEKFHLTAERES
jgi:biofilm PGA synthesis N-glycosyltransferase PgaC